MPKAFSQTERATIRASLMEQGFKRFAAQGIRATRIEDICRDVGIAKGSFYNFFPSREDLFMAIARAQDEKHKRDMHGFLVRTEGVTRETLGKFFDFLMVRIDTDPVLRIVRDNGELNYLMRRVSPQLIAEEAKNDRAFIHEISAILSSRHQLPFADPQTLEGLMMLMIALSLQADLIAASADYGAAVALLRDLFVSRLLKGPLDDRS